MKKLSTLIIGIFCTLNSFAQNELTTTEAAKLYKTVSKKTVSIHDPSVVYDENTKRYYIFGSHKAGAYTTDFQNWTSVTPTWRTASSTNASNAQAFVTPAVTKITKGGQELEMPAFNAMDWAKRSDSAYDINGNMWAPDVIWNPVMKKWCFYLSINGDKWHSSIILLTADNITGPYLYQGPVVICGFYDNSHSYKDTDLELVLGEQATLPSRYNVGSNWGRRWPHTIDPAVFFDEEGKLWMVYGSWSGGIWMLELDEQTGLRDYDVSYPSTGGSTDGVTSDPYFGKKIAGGYYVSGEGPYIEHIGDYYYLFVSYGFFSPDGGYEMRVFRSENPDGPYKDSRGVSAIYSSYVMNYGKNGDKRGEKIMGAYNNWGYMTTGECAQGHNSIIAAPDGRNYLVCHTKFNNNTIFHEVRTHQIFVNKDGWLVASPFEYNGETITDNDLAQNQAFTADQIAGTYYLLEHKYNMDHANYEEVSPIKVVLGADGKVSGGKTGSWTLEEGTGHISLILGGLKFQGVIYEEVMDKRNTHAMAFTTCCQATGTNVWGYKLMPKYELAWQLNNQSIPVSNGQTIEADVDLESTNIGLDNVDITWNSSEPDILSNAGKYNPAGLGEDTPLTLQVRMEAADYYWQQEYNVTALSEANNKPADGWTDGMLAHYGFDDAQAANSFNSDEKARLLRNGSSKVPVIEDGSALRTGGYVHLKFGANGNESYVEIPNPLYGESLTEGATISFWVKRSDNNLWDALFGVVNGDARLYMTGNTYLGFNDGNTSGTNNWIDLNHPNSVTPNFLTTDKWQLLTLVFTRSQIRMYIDGVRKYFTKCNGMMNDKSFSSQSAFDYDIIVDHLSQATAFWLGNGSFWGSADACFDDVIFYNRPLETEQVKDLWRMENRVFDFSTIDMGIEDLPYLYEQHDEQRCYDLQGRLLKGQPAKGLYIRHGKKMVVK